MYCAETTRSRDEKQLSFGIWCTYIRDLTVYASLGLNELKTAVSCPWACRLKHNFAAIGPLWVEHLMLQQISKFVCFGNSTFTNMGGFHQFYGISQWVDYPHCKFISQKLCFLNTAILHILIIYYFYVFCLLWFYLEPACWLFHAVYVSLSVFFYTFLSSFLLWTRSSTSYISVVLNWF